MSDEFGLVLFCWWMNGDVLVSIGMMFLMESY